MEETAEVNETVERSTEAPHMKNKVIDEPPQQSSSCNIVETTAPVVSQDAEWAEHFPFLQSPEVFLETLDARNIDQDVNPNSSSQPVCTNLGSSSNPGVMVEELTLKNYKGPDPSVGGGSGSEEKPIDRRGRWNNFTRMAGRMRDASPRDTFMVGQREDANIVVAHKPPPSMCLYPSVQQPGSDVHADGIPVKVTSGFPENVSKSTLKGKGVTYHGVQEMGTRGHSIERSNAIAEMTSNLHRSSAKEDRKHLFGGGSGYGVLDSHHGVISLRDYLKPRRQRISKVDNLHIFKQILELVDIFHSQGFALKQLQPSYFKLSPSNEVKYTGSFVHQESSVSTKTDVHLTDDHLNRKRYLDDSKYSNSILALKHQNVGKHGYIATHHHLHPFKGDLKEDGQGEQDDISLKYINSRCDFREQSKLGEPYDNQNISCGSSSSNSSGQHSLSECQKLEERWYSRTEELNESIPLFSSNIYNLGVLLFELFCYFETWEEHTAAMSDLCYRKFPAHFLAGNPKEAGFCLWLLHPECSSRPKARDILLSDLLIEGQDLSLLDQSPISIDKEDAEAELLLSFLLSVKEHREKKADRLGADLGHIQADILEVEKRQSSRSGLQLDHRDLPANFSSLLDFYHQKESAETMILPRLHSSSIYEEKLMRNIEQLENAYFSMRSKIEISETDAATRSDNDVLKIRDRCHQDENDDDAWMKSTDHLGTFFEGVCKYARYNRFEICGSLKNLDTLNSANVICSLNFDRDEEYFAAAGVSKKIKIFEFGALLDDSVDIHYPLIEMPSRSKLSCVCWNTYIKNYLASTDYEGVVQLWDASTGQGFIRFREHTKRAWSVNFSQVDPTKLASGSDDYSVKVWSINEEKCINTIRNMANVCCVQYSPHSSVLLAAGSSDYRIYCYDLRNTRIPWCTLAGHGKAVSYVKFLDSQTLISASTDNSLKIWDLNRTTSSGISSDACSLTLSGHTNEKNFVGLSVYDGYITCGSETNEVYAYYRTFPMPVTSHKFGSIDPITGQEISDDGSQFVTSVCWRGKSDMVVAANSSGSIKVLRLV
ncbi:protein SUPPRESSOR OF PHYA-105 1-like isoform X1 [Typha angustifolia]|uniref:protein SUPPRESSOR OF PHYA-105 1-like isoform X1 n=1 Tax=Typha angustifolia TaxID=59011 RepID=UPI003C2F1031